MARSISFDKVAAIYDARGSLARDVAAGAGASWGTGRSCRRRGSPYLERGRADVSERLIPMAEAAGFALVEESFTARDEWHESPTDVVERMVKRQWGVLIDLDQARSESSLGVRGPVIREILHGEQLETADLGRFRDGHMVRRNRTGRTRGLG